ncbi:MAG: hypothetical protein P8R42_18655 [Candidatus Binatia bacterium]|nr:hypothetical protein [Candidatus Binatia bacterium]
MSRTLTSPSSTTPNCRLAGGFLAALFVVTTVVFAGAQPRESRHGPTPIA